MKTIKNLSAYEAEKQIRDYLRELYVNKPRAPLLMNNKPTKEAVERYTIAVEQYTLDLAEYKTKDEVYRAESLRLWNLLENKIKEDSGLNDIPEQYRDKVYSYAYQQGHSSGYSEVYNYLLDLVDIF
jgi:hypothetical protein